MEFCESFSLQYNKAVLVRMWRKSILHRTRHFPQATKGMSKVHGFLDSLGVYGPTPFIASMYGAGELCQAFCRYVVVKRLRRRGQVWPFFFLDPWCKAHHHLLRLCAVFGGVYMLRTKPASLVVADGECRGLVLNTNERVTCPRVLLPLRCVNQSLYASL